jgi:2-octaprenyl-6-methoxyphenol hydroxylase
VAHHRRRRGPGPHAQRIEQILVTDGRTPSASARGGPSPFFLRFDSGEIADRSDGEPLGYLIENRQIRAALSQDRDRQGHPGDAPMAATNLEVDAVGAP